MANEHHILDTGPFYHGTKADLKIGDLLVPGHLSNYDQDLKLRHIYFSATLDAAIWGAELAKGSGSERIYQVKPTGIFENDPNLTDKKFPGNPTRSYRSTAPLRITCEVTEWTGHDDEVIAKMLEEIKKAEKLENGGIID